MKKILILLLWFVGNIVGMENDVKRKVNEKDIISHFSPSITHYLERGGNEIKVCIENASDSGKQIVTRQDIREFLKSYSLRKLKEKEQETPLTLFTLRALYLILYRTKILERNKIVEINPPSAELHEIIRAAYNRGFLDGMETMKLQQRVG